jgi:hypothetical protein
VPDVHFCPRNDWVLRIVAEFADAFCVKFVLRKKKQWINIDCH